MGLKIVVGGGVLDAPDWYENYRTFAIYCAVGRPALWPPESWNIAYILGSAQGITLQSAARTARKQRPVPSVASRHLPRPAGSHPLSPYKNRQCHIKQHCRDWLSMRCPRRPCSWRACRRPGIRRTGVPARTACSGWKALLRSSWLPHRPGHRTTWF